MSHLNRAALKVTAPLALLYVLARLAGPFLHR